VYCMELEICETLGVLDGTFENSLPHLVDKQPPPLHVSTDRTYSDRRIRPSRALYFKVVRFAKSRGFPSLHLSSSPLLDPLLDRYHVVCYRDRRYSVELEHSLRVWRSFGNGETQRHPTLPVQTVSQLLEEPVEPRTEVKMQQQSGTAIHRASGTLVWRT
jgi:hypothetical protein